MRSVLLSIVSWFMILATAMTTGALVNEYPLHTYMTARGYGED